VFSNGIDPPQVWTPPALNRNLIDLPNWPVTQTALVMRAHYAVLIALGMMIDGAYYRRTLKWSHPADPGAVPISWDEADPNMDVGMTDIADTDDNIVDGLSMKSRFYIYKEYNTWMLEPLGSTSIRSLFKLSRVFTGLGILAANCVADVLGKHFVVGTEDILAHDGSQIQWVADKKVKKWFYRNLNMNDFAKTYVVHFPPFKEVWIPFPDAGSGGSINMALVWQYTDGKFYVRDLNHNPRSMYYGGYLGDAGDQWNQAVGDWSTDAQPWELSVNPVVDQSMLSACDDSIDIHDERNWSAQSFPATQIIERTDWPFGDIGKDGQAFPAYDRVKMYRTIWPRFIAPTGTLFTFEFGWRDDLTDDIQWDLPKTFTCGPGEKIDLWQRGRYLSYRISSATTTPWRFTGMNVEFDLLGIR
jgi:hypothetical protein